MDYKGNDDDDDDDDYDDGQRGVLSYCFSFSHSPFL